MTTWLEKNQRYDSLCLNLSQLFFLNPWILFWIHNSDTAIGIDGFSKRKKLNICNILLWKPNLKVWNFKTCWVWFNFSWAGKTFEVLWISSPKYVWVPLNSFRRIVFSFLFRCCWCCALHFFYSFRVESFFFVNVISLASTSYGFIFYCYCNFMPFWFLCIVFVIVVATFYVIFATLCVKNQKRVMLL